MPRILVIDDNEPNRRILARRLERRGFEVLLANDGKAGVETARAEKPDLILMDMMMPLVDGFQATREIRQVEGLRGVPILALTAMEGARERALQAGCDDLVPKPLDVRAFLDQVRAWTTPRGS